MTKDDKAKQDSEIYASSGDIVPPDHLTDPDMLAMFRKEAAYMERVNKAAGVAIYGDTDIEALATLVLSHFKYLAYKDEEELAQNLEAKQKYNAMKNKEAAVHERYLRLLKLDPSSRVDFGGSQDDAEDDEF
jgi:hypothetical protein